MKSKQKLKTKQKQQGKFENFPNLRTVDKEDETDAVPETPLGLFFLKILSSLGKGSKKKSMEISIKGGGSNPFRIFFFWYPQFIQKCI